MEVKGQMIHVPESSTLMFLGSPRVDKLEELMGRGLYLSDIPIHDATRDVILVGQQAKAQDGLKNRMDKLKVQSHTHAIYTHTHVHTHTVTHTYTCAHTHYSVM